MRIARALEMGKKKVQGIWVRIGHVAFGGRVDLAGLGYRASPRYRIGIFIQQFMVHRPEKRFIVPPERPQENGLLRGAAIPGA
jgi:hypothetical protein